MIKKSNIKRGLISLVLASSLFLMGDKNLSQTQSIQTKSPYPERLKQRISLEDSIPNNQRDKYAVIISGNTANRHKINIFLAYQIFLENNFPKDNIYILDSEGKKNIQYPVDEFARKESIKMVFNHLEKKIDNKDLLFVYITGHGDRILKNADSLSTIDMPGEDLDQKEFSDYIEGISPKEGIFLFDQCFSGGFAEEIKSKKYLAIASTKKICQVTAKYMILLGGNLCLLSETK